MKIVMCGYFGIRNIGDEAILLGLRTTFLKLFPNSVIDVMGKGRLFPFGFRSFFRSIIKSKLWSAPYRLIKSCDVFVLSGGLFSAEEDFFVPIFWALHGLFAHYLKKPVFMLGINIGRLSFLNRWICKRLFRKSKLIVVRDKASYELLKSWGISSHLGPDFATAIPYERKGLISKEAGSQYAVVSIRPYKGIKDSVYKNLAQACDSLIEKYGLNIRLIPFHEGFDSDAAVLNTIFDHIKHKSSVKIESFYESVEELMQVLANAKLVLAMRLHAGILSAMAGTPFIALSYMDKVKNLWKEFPHIKTLEISQISVDELIQSFQNIFNSDREHRIIIKNLKQKLIEKAKNTEEIIKSALQNY